MKISTKGRYALRLMLDVAQHSQGQFVPLKEISARQDISTKYLEQITVQLSKAGLLRSGRGPQGGYKLARLPEEYRVGEILRLIEGSLAPVACLEDKPNLCPRYGDCQTIGFWEGLENTINAYVDSYTLADLMPKNKISS